MKEVLSENNIKYMYVDICESVGKLKQFLKIRDTADACKEIDLGQIHCHWENGSSLALIPGVDHFHQDMTQEPVIESSEEQEPDLEL